MGTAKGNRSTFYMGVYVVYFVSIAVLTYCNKPSSLCMHSTSGVLYKQKGKYVGKVDGFQIWSWEYARAVLRQNPSTFAWVLISVYISVAGVHQLGATFLQVQFSDSCSTFGIISSLAEAWVDKRSPVKRREGGPSKWCWDENW